MTTLLIAEHNNNILADANKKAMDAATKIGEDIHILVAGKDCANIADDASKIEGVSKVLLCDDELYKNHLAESYADLIVSISDNYNAIMAIASTTGKNFMPRVAALLNIPQISEILINFKLEFLGFDIPNPSIKSEYSKIFPNDKRNILLENWHQFEIDNPETFGAMYQFWVKKS